MEDKNVPFIVHEGCMVRMERTIRRLMVALVVAIMAVFMSNLMWLYAWMQYDYVGEESTVTVDTGNGPANYIGNDWEVNHGEGESN